MSAVKLVPFSEIEPLLNLTRNKLGVTEAELAEAIGFSRSFFSTARRDGKARKAVRHTLLGILAEFDAAQDGLKQAPGIHFSPLEVETLLGILLTYKRNNPGNTIVGGMVRSLATMIAKED